MNPFLLASLGVGAVLAVVAFLFLYSTKEVTSEIEQEDRTYRDSLSPLLKLLWGPVRFVEHVMTRHFPQRMLENTQKALQLSGAHYTMSPEQFHALKYVSAVIFAVLSAGICVLMAGELLAMAPIGAGLLGYFYPSIWLADLRKKREKLILKTLPTFLDYITMSVEAGLNLAGALNQAIEKGPEGPLRNEFYTVVRDLRAGLQRSEALRRMETRLQLPAITSFVSAVIQAEKMGSGLAPTLRSQAEQRRIERFQRAEKMAMEAPVKLIFPLVMFIFPITFIVLGFPIVTKIMGSGM